MADEPLLERLPPLVQNESRRDTNRVQFSDTKDVYTLPNAPVLEVNEIRDDDTTYVQDLDYELLTDSQGRINEVDWSIGGDSPDDGTDFIVDATFRTIIERYSAAHDDEFDFIQDEIDEVIGSRHVDSATGDELDQLGALFGELGRRRGRTDSDYRFYLKSIVNAFSGRGSLQGLRFAVASAIGTDIENIGIRENFSELEYSITIQATDAAFVTSAINDLAELADPSVVVLDEAIIVLDKGGVLVGGDDIQVTDEAQGLGTPILDLDGTETLGTAVTLSTATYDSDNYDNSLYGETSTSTLTFDLNSYDYTTYN